MNLRPSGYEPDELPDCSTPRRADEDSRRFAAQTQAEPGASVVDVVVVEPEDPEPAPDDEAARAAAARPVSVAASLFLAW